jgi:indole-3-glycerol phosphate synthase
MNYLEKIYHYKVDELAAAKRKHSMQDLRLQAHDQEGPRDFFSALTRKADCHVIAELKKASPSRGVIVEDFNLDKIAHSYEDHGASACSVLTDEHFFQGHLEHIGMVKKAIGLPVLRKDFTLDEYHIYQARAAGADAVLLIAYLLESPQLIDYSQMSAELGMTALIEVHDEGEIEKVFRRGTGPYPEQIFIGINNRNLQTFECDIAVSETLKGNIPDPVSVISESGLSTRVDIERLQKAGITIFLIGESLLVADRPGEKLSSLLES